MGLYVGADAGRSNGIMFPTTAITIVELAAVAVLFRDKTKGWLGGTRFKGYFAKCIG
jgi:hypothetical protein